MTNSPTDLVEVKDVEAGGVEMTPSAYYSLLFKVKTNAGMYKSEKVRCFCGSDYYKQITDKDRYGIEYSLCLCQDCGLLYANPRMTEESLRKFYENDYRGIYSDQRERSGFSHIKDEVYKILDDYELPKPKVIFEIGCGMGENLVGFEGQCIGVDYDRKAIEVGIANGLDLREGGIETLEATGKKADLIIMNHVLEHMVDIEKDLKRIRDLLTDEGTLYIEVPGFYTWYLPLLFQNAHNYQFTGNTLSYVMHCCGFAEYHLTEEIKSLWYKAGFMDKSMMIEDEHKFVESFILKEDSKYLMPNVRLNCKFPVAERRENLKYSMKLGIPEITELQGIHPNSEAVIVTGGPSVNGYVDKIRELKAKGAKVYAIERMYQWCLKHDIIPDYVVALDASEDVIESFQNIHPDPVHLIVGHAKPEVFDRLKDYKTYYFLLLQKGINYENLLKDGNSVTFINTGASVSLCCMSLAMTLGARNLHIFGFDCHVSEKNYADGITGVGEINETMDIEIEGGRTFKTTSTYFAFMQNFFSIYQTAKECDLLDSVKIYGDSMVSYASKEDIRGE